MSKYISNLKLQVCMISASVTKCAGVVTSHQFKLPYFNCVEKGSLNFDLPIFFLLIKELCHGVLMHKMTVT